VTILIPAGQIPGFYHRRVVVTALSDGYLDGTAARKRTIDSELIAGMHVHFPGFAHLVRDCEGYRMVPELWDQAFGD
jgi:hypothetical protein